MCLSIPARIISISGDMADVSLGGAVLKAGLQMLQDARVGDYVLLHAGFAIQKLSEEDAYETIKLLEELNNSLQ